jgi:hypothetical protein
MLQLFRTTSQAHRAREFLLAVGLALLFFAYSIGQVAGQLARGPFSSTVMGGSLADALTAPALTKALIGFALAQFGLHVTFGAVIWLFAIVTVRSGLLPRVSIWQSIVAWFAIGAIWVGLANAHFYPWSAASGDFSMLLAEPVRGVTTFAIASTVVGSALVVICTSALARHRRRDVVLRCGVWAIVAALVLAVLIKLPRSVAGDAPSAAPMRPNVIVIGIDSLRSDLVGNPGGSWLTPAIDGFLSEARVVSDTITPLGRTFPAWISILTGDHPQSTGARENLIPRDALEIESTLADRLRSLGYRTVFATDEVRFSNIDTSYGFDIALTPTVGAADFLLGTANDLPLSNLIVNTRLGALLFPASYANRGVAVTYRPETFIDRLAAGVEFGSPTFLAIHLTLPHWPFRWAEDQHSVFEDSGPQPYAYLAALVGVDRQFRQLMELLEQRGALDNSIVVLLSDHGEGLGLPQDNLIGSPAARAVTGSLRVATWGHGTSVLSPHQSQVLLAFRGYGQEQFAAGRQSPVDVPASLEDVTPTLLDLIGELSPTDQFDGRSLAAPLRGDDFHQQSLNSRFRFLETAYAPAALVRDRIDEGELIDQGRDLYGINEATARIEFRMNRWHELLASKERAVIRGDWLLAALPVNQGRAHRYFLFPRGGGLPRRIERVPDPASDPTAAALWTALNERYPGELSAELAD